MEELGVKTVETAYVGKGDVCVCVCVCVCGGGGGQGHFL